MKWLVKGLQIFPLIIGAIHAVESLGGRKGKDKQDAAVDALGAMLSVVNGLDGHEILNTTEGQALVRRLMDDYVAVMNYVSQTRAAIAAAHPPA